ncbi:MAG: tRNA pseudouridine(55) synthase TruB [Candidatus Aegiribacteria sp.]
MSPTGTGAAYLLDKPAGISSRKAAAGAAGYWKFRKFGHAGTLDPDATGLLVVLMGRATRLSRFLTSFSKTYSFGVQLGVRTDTDDLSGKVIERNPVEGVTEADIQSALELFTGTLRQRVPSYSAVRVGGVRAYSIARKGKVPETPVRTVTADNWILHELDGERVRLSVTVSSGTYVRALARDLGEELGTGGAAFDIRRTRIDGLGVEEASRDHEDPGALLTMSSVMRGFPDITLDDADTEKVSHGGSIAGRIEGLVALHDPDGKLLAMAEGDGSFLKPMCVLVES